MVFGNTTGFSPTRAATTALSNDYKCYTAPGTEPRIAFLVRNAVVPHVLKTIFSPNGLAGALRLQLPNGPRRTSRHDKQEVDLFLDSMKPYNILMGDYNDNIWSPNPTRPWQRDLTNGEFLDPLHANSQPPEPRQYYTRIPRPVAVKEQLAHPLLHLHSYAHSYLPTLSLHGQLYEVAHQKYLNWAAIVTHYMRAHNQWLRMACQRVEEIYLASFRKVSRDFWGEYDWAVRD